jgi:hypothetical protein
MEGFMYPASLIVLTLLAWSFYRNNHFILMVLAFAVGGYIVYSTETGHTATDFKNEMIHKIDEKAPDYSHRYDKENF